MNRFAIVCLSLCALAQMGICAEVTGTVRVANSYQGSPVEPERRPPFSFAWVTLCSPERAYRARAQQNGKFQIPDVQPGIYDLVAAGPGRAPDTLPHLSVTDQPLLPQIILVHDGSRTSTCVVNSENWIAPFTFDVDYDTPDPHRIAPVVQGKSERRIQKSVQVPATTKPLPQAQIALFRPGTSTPLLTTISDKQGRFELRPEPGTYELLMKRKGYQDVRVPAFLVPRENVTQVSLSTAEVGVVALGQ